MSKTSGQIRNRAAAVMLAVLVALTPVASPVASAAKSEVASLRERLASIRQEAKRAGDAYSKAYWRLERTNAELARKNAEIRATEQRLAEASGRLATHVAELYRLGGVDYLSLLFTADSLDDVLSRLEYVRRIGEADAATVAEVERLRAQLIAQRDELHRLKEDQAGDVALLKKKARALEKKLSSLQAEYDATQRKLAAAVARQTGRKTASRYPPGPNGMVFPVQGPCYYADTWGAARSGGRTHKGTDIMAPTGTPVVAVLSGTVRARTNALGGKTIWLTADNGWEFYYAHLSAWVRTSGRVQAGEVIGKVGATGNARGGAPHLHFEIHPNGGAAVNPYPYLRQMQ